MVSVREAIEFIVWNAVPADGIEVSVEDSLGLVIRKEVISPVSLPLFDNSAMDGYAVRSKDTMTATPENPARLEIVDTVRAGDSPNITVKSGQAAKIMTGAPVPPGADAVVKVEDVEERDGSLIIRAGVAESLNVRFEGEEIGRGDIALEAGIEITPAAIGFLAELGIKTVEVYGPPRVAVIVTGEELASSDEDIEPGKIRDTNTIMLKSALAKENIEFISAARAKDIKADIREKVRAALGACDILITTGGVSVGEYDFVKDVLAEEGVEQIFWGVSQRPGGPMFFGRRENTLVFGLPGNPASSLVCYYEYVRPAVRKTAGKRDIFLMEGSARLSAPVKKKPGKTHFLRGVVGRDNEGLCVEAAGGQGSHMLKSFALANCLIVIPEDETYLPEGSDVTVHYLP